MCLKEGTKNFSIGIRVEADGTGKNRKTILEVLQASQWWVMVAWTRELQEKWSEAVKFWMHLQAEVECHTAARPTKLTGPSKVLSASLSLWFTFFINWRVWFLEPQGNWSRQTKANPSLILETQFKEHAFRIKMSQQLQRKSDSAQPKVPPSPGNLTSQCDACLLCQRQSHLYQYLIWHEYCTLPMFYTIWRGLS